MSLVYDLTVNGLLVQLDQDGRLFVGKTKDTLKERPWYRDPAANTPWVPSQAHFVSLIKSRIENGDFND